VGHPGGACSQVRYSHVTTSGTVQRLLLQCCLTDIPRTSNLSNNIPNSNKCREDDRRLIFYVRFPFILFVVS
jgi:hypothetical protein